MPRNLQDLAPSWQYPGMAEIHLALEFLRNALDEYRVLDNDAQYLRDQLPNDDRAELTRTVQRITSRAKMVAATCDRIKTEAATSGNLGNSVHSLATQLATSAEYIRASSRRAYVDHLAERHGV